MTREKLNIFWFRRDLRLHDNKGLFEALSAGLPVLAVFIFDDSILDELPGDDARVAFIHKSLEGLNLALEPFGRSLAVFRGTPEAIWEKLTGLHNIETVYANHDYEPYARKRDLSVFHILKKNGIGFKTCKDQVIFEKEEIAKDDGTPYVVFTPYAKKWKTRFRADAIRQFGSELLLQNIMTHTYPFPELGDIGFKKSAIMPRACDISQGMVQQYEAVRNFPALGQTSGLSPYLRFGNISIREIVVSIGHEPNETFLNELIWREFFMQILWHFPHTATRSFRPKYDAIPWRNDGADFEKWCRGQTGYPLVDAGMRELNSTGLMHNRVRMVVASFLCRHLLIDWRWGEAWFALKLLDYEQSSNVGNWQWAAGSGVDAAPYFRIFNPAEQAKKFDRDQLYIRQWVPEFGTADYPLPVIEHRQARERCLVAFRSAIG